MNANQIAKQVAKATIEAEGARKLYSEITGRWVRNGQGVMSQEHLAEILAKRGSNTYKVL